MAFVTLKINWQAPRPVEEAKYPGKLPQEIVAEIEIRDNDTIEIIRDNAETFASESTGFPALTGMITKIEF